MSRLAAPAAARGYRQFRRPRLAAAQLPVGSPWLLIIDALATVGGGQRHDSARSLRRLCRWRYQRLLQQRRAVVIGRERTRRYTHAVLLRRGRAVPKVVLANTDQVDNMMCITRLNPCR